MADERTIRALNILNDSYEDQLFRIAIDRITSEAEGSALLAELAAEAPEIPSHEAQRRHAARVDRCLKKMRTDTRREGGRRHRAGSKVAVALAAVIALFALLMMTVSAFRISVLNLFLKMEPKYTSVQLTDDAADPANSGFTLNWRNAYTPTYIPEGFEVSDISDSGESKIVTFVNPETSVSFVYRQYAAEEYIRLDTESADLVRKVDINGDKGSLVVKDAVVSLTWVQDNHFFMVFGDISEETAMKIAENVNFMP